MRFEWDDQKAFENVEKHGVTFGEATEVFYDPHAVEGEDVEHSHNESRFFIIGYSNSSDHFGPAADTVGKEVI